MASAPEVTVVVPTHSRWDLLSTAALPASLGQEDVDLEVVVVDDGSTDATAESLARIDDPRLRVVRHDRPRGVAQARNAGIAAARGEWIALLDDDDLWAPWKLRAQLDAAAAERAVFAYGGAAAVAEDRRIFSRWVALGHRRAGRRARAATTYLQGAFRNRDAGSLGRALVAPLGERPAGWLRTLARGRPTQASPDGLGEPDWLALYR